MKEKILKGFIYSEQMAMFGSKDIIGYGTKEFYIKENNFEKEYLNI